jgi:hypothetical protein
MTNELEDAQHVSELIHELRSWHRPRRRHDWRDTGRLVIESLRRNAGSDYSDSLRQGLIAWLQRSPEALDLYAEGADVPHAAIVERYMETRAR